MLSVKPERGLVVIEPGGFPAAGIMAVSTIRFPTGFKLTKMNIIMTIGASHREACEFLIYDSFVILPEMARAAFLVCMCACKVKVCR
jgi:hypothetical protein